MAYNFPDSPSNGDTFTLNGVTYTYNSTKGVWKDTAVGTPPPPSVTSSDTAPANPSAGDLWYRTDDSTLYVYYNDGSSSQWVGISGPSGPAGANGADGADGTSASVAYANLASFPSTPTEGDIAYAQDTNALYVHDGSQWDRISSGSDESPRVTTEPATSHILNSDGTTSTLTMVAEDPEGFDIEYGIKYNTSGGALPSQLASATTINQNTGVYTFTPTTTEANAGTFNARLTASDGNRVTVRTIPFSLTFSEDIVFDASEPGISTTLTNTTTGWSQTNVTPSGGSMNSNTLQSGKRYFEMYITGASGLPMIGIFAESNTDPGYNDTTDYGASLYMSNGNVYPTAIHSNAGFDPNDSFPTTIMIAFDTSSRKVWFGENGTWGSGSGDPVSGTGYTIDGTGGFKLVIGNGSGTGQLTSDILLDTNLTYSIPTGFQTQ